MRALEQLFARSADDGQPFLALPDAHNPRILVPPGKRAFVRQSLRLHNTAAPINRMGKALFSAVWPLPRLFLQANYFPTSQFAELLHQIATLLQIPQERLQAAVYIGSPGLSRKITLQLMNSAGEILGYVKIGDTDSNRPFVQNEANTCLELAHIQWHSILIPSILFLQKYGDWILLGEGDIASEGRSVGYDLSDEITTALVELASKTRLQSHADEFYNSICRQLESFVKETELLQIGLSALDRIKAGGSMPIRIHGDFVPYNLKRTDRGVAVVDWEFSQSMGLPLYDLFHFIIQGHRQIFSWPLEKIIEKKIIRHERNRQAICRYCDRLGIKKMNIRDFLIGYFLTFSIFSTEQLGFAEVDERSLQRIIGRFSRAL